MLCVRKDRVAIRLLLPHSNSSLTIHSVKRISFCWIVILWFRCKRSEEVRRSQHLFVVEFEVFTRSVEDDTVLVMQIRPFTSHHFLEQTSLESKRILSDGTEDAQ